MKEHCSARVYLEGKPLLDNPGLNEPVASAADASSSERPTKRPRTATDCVQELLQLKRLFEAGVLSLAELEDLKQRLLRGD